MNVVGMKSNVSVMREHCQADALSPRSDEIYELSIPFAAGNDTRLEALTIDGRLYTDRETLMQHLQDRLERDGAVLIEDSGITKVSEIRAFVSGLGEPMSYIGGTNNRGNQGGGVLNVGTEPPHANISAHNEMSYSNRYPEIFVIGCEQGLSRGGQTVIADNLAVTDDLLLSPLGHKLWSKGLKYLRNFHDKNRTTDYSYNSWQDAFGTDDPVLAQARAEEYLAGYGHTMKCHWNDDGGLFLSYEAPAFEYDPELGKNLCFTSIGNHGYWFRKWQPFNQLPNEQRPYHLQFGDGSEFSERELEEFVSIFQKHSMPITWKPGTIAILKNRRYTHARPPYEVPEGEARKLGVVLLSPAEKMGQVDLISQSYSPSLLLEQRA